MKSGGLWVSDLLLDTHTFIWFALGKCLPKSIAEMIEEAQSESRLFLSEISSWEISMLEKKGRIALNMDALSWLKEAISQTGIQMMRLIPEVVVDSTRLPEWDHKDPVDRIIVATARHHGLELITTDGKIKEYGKGGHVKVFPFEKLRNCE